MPVASSGWMGLRDPELQGFIPEDREYSFEEAHAIPGMHVLDTNGCVPFTASPSLTCLTATQQTRAPR
jgi:hypothetical protein